MSSTPNLGLPYIDAGQAQKHVTHNEALRFLDRLVQLAVLDRDLTAPPSSPIEGQRWIVKTGATGAWSGHADDIAAWQDGVWQFSAPVAGWVAYVIDEEILAAWDGSAWTGISAGSGGSDPTELQEMTLLGIGATADTANPLSAKLNNVLWTAKTVAEGGDGNLRYKLSKESAANTLSFLLQDNFVGCAEIGLTGDDDFHFKVSPDGTTWLEAIKIDRATGKLSFPVSGGPREMLTANRAYYVRTDGSDGNNGLANTSGGAFLTIQKAVDVAYGTLDLYGFSVTIQVGAGTYTDPIHIGSPQTGKGTISLVGDTTTPSNVVINVTGQQAITVDGFAVVSLGGFKIVSNIHGIVCQGPCQVLINGNMEFGAIDVFGFFVLKGGFLQCNANYTISGGGAAHWWVDQGGILSPQGRTITLTGTPAFTTAFAVANGGQLICSGNTYSGSAGSGTKKYNVTMNGVINSGVTLPGGTAGSAATGGQYA